MTNVVLQVPMPKQLRDSATVAASDYGFSSLQELVRVFINKVARKQVTVSIDDNIEIGRASCRERV